MVRNAWVVLGTLVLACAKVAPDGTGPEARMDVQAAPPVAETRPAMVSLGERDALHRFFTVMGARRPNQIFATRVIGARALTLEAPGGTGTLAIWVRQQCQYRIPFSKPPVETELPCVFACRYPVDAGPTTEALGCSFRIPQ